MSDGSAFSTIEGAGKPRVLLVEDDEDLARSLLRALARAGHEVKHAPDVAKATALLEGATYDVVLSDISLPGASGVDLLRLVRAHDLDVPVILMTGNPSVETAAQAVELGAMKYLMKPTPLDELITTLEKATRLGRLARMKREALLLDTEHGAPSADRAGLSVSFERALETSWLAFQPIVDARRKNVFAYEALLRSREPSMMHPAAILDAAERLGAIARLGRRVRGLAADAVERMPKHAMLFVNIHASELTDPQLFDEKSPLTRHARRVVIEVTERVALDSVKDIASCAKRLRDIGFTIALDDLGAGYAGLTSFATLEPELVKLDMSLIQGCGASVTRQRIVTSMVTLAREMNMRVVAEGIECAVDLVCVKAMGCDFLQGYHLARPSADFVDVTLE